MRRFLLAFLLILGLITPASAVTLLSTPVTTAVTAVVTQTFQIRPGPGGQFLPASMLLQGNLTYGSGGTTIDAWVQTSIDGGGTWMDVARFSWSTASARLLLNVSSATSIIAAVTASEGGVGGTPLGVNAAKDGIFGSMWRVKYTTVGTYAGGTTLRIDAISSGLTVLP